MGRLARSRPASAMAALLVVLVSAAAPVAASSRSPASARLDLVLDPVAAVPAFANLAARSTFNVEITFDVDLSGVKPDRLELLLDFMGSTSTFVAPVEPSGGHATFRWDASRDHLKPNTRMTYRWRATVGDRQTLSPAATYLYADDRAGLDWQTARIGQATVHWYRDAEAQARRFGELTADGAARAEEALGHQLSGPIDIFVYDTQDEFFGALGPGAREWTGAEADPNIRTVFMWLGGGDAQYLETTIVHEVTHVVFADATANPFHQPARWVDEGFARWSEQTVDQQRSLVEFEARNGLLSFAAITQQFPIGARGAALAYAQGAVMIDMLIADHGRAAMARMATAYRDGATDDEALAAASGTSAAALEAAFFDAFGVTEPRPISPAPIGDSVVSVPGSSGAPPSSAVGTPSPAGGTSGMAAIVLVGLVALLAVGGAAWLARRARRRAGQP